MYSAEKDKRFQIYHCFIYLDCVTVLTKHIQKINMEFEKYM